MLLGEAVCCTQMFTVCVYVCVYIYIYIYIYMYLCISARSAFNVSRKGTSGASTNGVTANYFVFDRRTSWVLPLTYFYITKSARAYPFSQSVKTHYFCSGPISVDPICPQPISTSRPRAVSLLQRRVSPRIWGFLSCPCNEVT